MRCAALAWGFKTKGGCWVGAVLEQNARQNWHRDDQRKGLVVQMTNSCSKQRNASREGNHDVTYRTSRELIEEERYSGRCDSGWWTPAGNRDSDARIELARQR
jgi:hypothetical protein